MPPAEQIDMPPGVAFFSTSRISAPRSWASIAAAAPANPYPTTTISTVSSQLLGAASAVSYDVVEEALGKARDDRRSLVLGRWTVAVVGVIGILVALSELRLVFWFVLFAWSGLGAAFAPLVLLALARRGVNRFGALDAMLTGIGVTVAWKLGRDAAASPEIFARVWWVLDVGHAANAQCGFGLFV